jgi:predicted ATP-grasp superfamily ATP-dependent carboligase
MFPSAASENLPGAVVLDAFATGLNSARALHRRGVRVAVIAMGRDDVAQYSRAVSECARLKAPPSPESLLELLERSAPRWQGAILVPASDLALETLSRYRIRLARSYRLYVPHWGIARILLRKDLTREAAEECGIEMPHCFGELTEGFAAGFAGPYPVVLRPLDSRGAAGAGRPKALIASDPGQLREQAKYLLAAGRRAEVLDLIPGPDSCSFNYTAFVDQKGRLAAGCALHKLRKSPPSFGIARVIETVDDQALEAALREPVLHLLRHINWFGPISAEYKLDPRTGRFVLIEVNARMAFVFRLTLARGIDLAWLYYLAALGEDLPDMSASQWDGVLIHLHAELLNLLFRRRQEQLTWQDYLAPYRRRKVFAVWDARDPLPFVREWSRSIVRAAAALPARLRAMQERRPRPRKGSSDNLEHT